MERLTPEYALAQLAKTGDKPFLALLRHGTLAIEVYRPDKIDAQKPHARDELYVVIAGSGYFVNGKARHPFKAGEVLFVPAGTEHRFEQFTEDFSTWVFFYGPEGGEHAA